MKKKSVFILLLSMVSLAVHAGDNRHIKTSTGICILQNDARCSDKTFNLDSPERFSHWHLDRANFAKSKFIGDGWAKSHYFDFKSSFLERANFKDAQLNYVNFSGASLVKADFEGVNTGLSQSGLEINFTHVEQGSRSNFKNANFGKVMIQNSIFQHADFLGVKALEWLGDNSTFRHSDFGHVVFTEASFQNSKMNDTIFSYAKLGVADFTGADLKRAKFRCTEFIRPGSTFRHADLSQADFYGADLSGTDINEADLEHAQMYCGTKLRDGHFYSKEGAAGCSLTKAEKPSVEFCK